MKLSLTWVLHVRDQIQNVCLTNNRQIFDLLLAAQFQKETITIHNFALTSYSLSKEQEMRVDRKIVKLKFLIFQTQFVYLQLARCCEARSGQRGLE